MDPRQCLDGIDLYTQLAEEAAELSAAAAKVARKLRATNPTPKTLKECVSAAFEEYVDTVIAADAAGIYVKDAEYAKKRKRWETRLDERKGRKEGKCSKADTKEACSL